MLLCVLAAALGLASGGTAWVLIKFIAILTNLALFHQWGTTLPSFADLPIGPGVVLAGPPVLDGLRLVGIVSRTDLLEAEDPAPAGDGAGVVTGRGRGCANDSLHVAFDLIADAGIDHLPVVDGDRLVGICTRSDLLQARLQQLAHDGRPERGWLALRRNGKVEHPVT